MGKYDSLPCFCRFKKIINYNCFSSFHKCDRLSLVSTQNRDKGRGQIQGIELIISIPEVIFTFVPTILCSEVGEAVKVDDIVALIETDKILVEVRAEEAGVITQQHAELEGTVEVNLPIFDVCKNVCTCYSSFLHT